MRIKTLFSPITQGFRAVFRSPARRAAAALRSPAKRSAAGLAPSSASRQDSLETFRDHFEAHRDASIAVTARVAHLTGQRVSRRAAIKEAKRAIRAEHLAVREALVDRYEAEVKVIRAKVALKQAFSTYRQVARKAGKFGAPTLVARDKVWNANEALKQATEDFQLAKLLVPQAK